MEVKYVRNEKLNKKVAGIIDELKEGIITRFHPKSIILSGSFGRGEATVAEENGRLKFLSDCEIIIIPYKYIFNRSKINEFESNFYKRTGLKVGIWGFTTTLYFSLPFLNKKMKPTMNNYDLKYGSKVIYGKNYLERIPNFKPEDIPLWEGIRLLFNRMAEALDHFSLENSNKEMVFWTNKIVLACQDALLLSSGKYHYSYRKRNEMFKNLFSKRFGGLEDELPNFLELTVEATERKLNGTMNVDDPIKYWFDAAEICDKVFRYVIRNDMRIEFKDYMEFQEKYMEHPNIKKKYYHESVASPLYQNLMILIKMVLISNRFVSPKIISKIRTPWKHIIYSTIPLIYFGLSKNAEINKDYLNRARGFWTIFKKRKEQSSNILNKNSFKYIKNQCLDLWHII